LKQSVNGCDLKSKSTFGCDVLNFEAVVLLSDQLFPTWQLRHSPPVGNSPQVKNHWFRGSTHFSLEKCRWTNWIFKVFAVAVLQ